MICAVLTSDAEGHLVSCTASGHARMAAVGADLVCAAVSVLLRTTALALYDENVSICAEKTGEFALRVLQSDKKARLKYAFDFLRCGLTSIEQEYPQALQLRLVQG